MERRWRCTVTWKEEAVVVARGQREKGEERKKEGREGEEMLTRFKIPTSRAGATGATGGHVMKGGWAASRATSTSRHALAPCNASMQIA
jgi:hypothetical protein